MNIKCNKCKKMKVSKIRNFFCSIICDNFGNKIEHSKKFIIIYKILDFSLYILIFIIFHYLSKYIRYCIVINSGLIKYILSYSTSGIISISLYILTSKLIYKMLLIVFKYDNNL